MRSGIDLIAEERRRQIEGEGWAAEQDALYSNGELADAAASYAVSDSVVYGSSQAIDLAEVWPFEEGAYKRSGNRIRDLQKAGALIAAEIDRLLKIERDGNPK